MQNFSPKIDNNYRAFSWLLTGIVALLVFVLGPVVLHKSISGKEAKQQTYNLSKDSEGVKKMNKLLADLLLIEDTSVVSIKNLQDLNRRYKALTFSLPYADDIEFSESSFIHTSDIRLVDIDPTEIKDEKDKDHFYNSNLQNLLEKQKNDPSINFFKIRFRKENGQIRIQDIKLVTSLFRVNLEKKVWEGSIEATDYGLFPEGQFCFISWGKNILPIKKCMERGRSMRFTVDLSHNEFLIANAPIKPVDLSMRDYNVSVKEIVVGLEEQQGSVGSLTLRYVNDTTLLVKTDENLECVFYAIGAGPSYVKPTSSAGRIDTVSFSRDLKVVFHGRQKRKIAEMQLTHKNPVFILASPVRNRQGLGRYIIDANLTDRFTQQVVRGTYGMLADTQIDTTIQLTLDPYLSKWLEEELKTYTDSLREKFAREGIGYADDRWEMSATVVDMRTGAILAMPYYRSEDEKLPSEVAMIRKNPALTRRYIGSTFKPLLALAAVQTEPALINLNTVTNPPTCRVINMSSNKSDSRAEIFGYPVPYWGSVGHWRGRVSIEQFLAASCDVYPVAMTILALNRNQWPHTGAEDDIFTTVGRERLLGLKSEKNGHHHWNNMDLMKNIDRLYGVKSFFDTENEDDAAYDMKRNLWRNIPGWDTLGEDRINYVDVVTPDFTVMHYQDFNNEGTAIKGNLVPWVLGQGNNSWSCLKLAEAWCRMLTKRKVELCITNPAEKMYDKIQFDKEGWDVRWNVFLDKLNSAQSIRGYGLLDKMYDAVSHLNNNMSLAGNNELMLFSKTGTPDNYDRQEYLNMGNTLLQYDLGLYCFGLMTKSAYNSVKAGEVSDGIMCVIRITRISRKKDKDSDGNTTVKGLESKDARNFFSANQQRLQRFYWLTRTRFGQ